MEYNKVRLFKRNVYLFQIGDLEQTNDINDSVTNNQKLQSCFACDVEKLSDVSFLTPQIHDTDQSAKKALDSL